ncbi:MAG: UDP-N-acetylmuramoyl-L-alanine--D-glutamate ligase [Phycisphaerales bacterium]|nr:MAG: UDP-N-acetylmuramoyl-L-alanine--D-glutamate ligase [Phycisphaerales bacterium]
MNKEFFAGKTVLVMGLGRFGGGVDVAEYAHGAGARVIVTDLAPSERLRDSLRKLEAFPDIEFHLGLHDPADFERADIVVANPAVPPDNTYLDLARRHGRYVTSQVNIFFQLCPATIIGITGANGKSTTAALTAHLLRASVKGRTDDGSSEKKGAQYASDTQNERVWLSGNIGNHPLLTVVDQISPGDLVVLELSSFQIEQLSQIRKAPKVALLTNLMPNHLDRYGTFANYCAAKENIFKFQTLDANSPAVSIFNAEDKVARGWFDKYRTQTGRTCIQFSPDDVGEAIRECFALPGLANLSNLAGAMAVARHFGANKNRIAGSVSGFRALPHRLEFVAQKGAVRWYNDSKATTPQSTIAALRAFDRPAIVIAGGYDKNLPLDELGQEVAEHAKAAILLGQTAEKIATAIRSRSGAAGCTQIRIVSSLSEAVRSASLLAERGDVVVLSPACASYDMFDNFEQRGNEFARLVRNISC